ncbi:hypothetical protein EIN_017570 [Entamoeba invadens IP1]|nr:hypothetical protein EIN_017570 [Entamoeba invadens IP1]ELP90458.1 hypothetical protein EIN_017570 [Entamoeba invadens IP1]|eukprot:XP_004257229.1 hypothetical protein EIN_017570 [Entamoeba invadens IP1]
MKNYVYDESNGQVVLKIRPEPNNQFYRKIVVHPNGTSLVYNDFENGKVTFRNMGVDGGDFVLITDYSDDHSLSKTSEKQIDDEIKKDRELFVNQKQIVIKKLESLIACKEKIQKTEIEFKIEDHKMKELKSNIISATTLNELRKVLQFKKSQLDRLLDN